MLILQLRIKTSYIYSLKVKLNIKEYIDIKILSTPYKSRCNLDIASLLFLIIS